MDSAVFSQEGKENHSDRAIISAGSTKNANTFGTVNHTNEPNTAAEKGVKALTQSQQGSQQDGGEKLNKTRVKRKFVETEDSLDYSLHFGSVDGVSLMLKAKALIKLGRDKEALACLQR